MIRVSVATGRSAESKQWVNSKITWPEFVDKLRTPHVTHETFAEYIAMKKPEQGRIKDVGGYVCGTLLNGRRNKSSTLSRSCLTLDLDFAPLDFWGTYTMFEHVAAVLHSTHTHCADKPRYRLIVPLDREVTPEEYVAVARRFAAGLGIEWFDTTTFDVNRLMFWPSVSTDSDYVFEVQDGPALNVDEVLASYRDWRDMSEWPYSKKVSDRIRHEVAKRQQDPTTKNGIVGYFTNAYDIHAAIEEFLPELYEPCGDGRYTYCLGSTAAGAVSYDDLYLYSHHGTDPCSEQLCNAFDLVMIHKFLPAGEDGATEGAKTAAYNKMRSFAYSLPKVKKLATASQVRSYDEFRPKEKATADTTKTSEPAERAKGGDSDTSEWLSDLTYDPKTGGLKSCAHNIAAIMRNDTKISGLLRYDMFARKKMVVSAPPWAVATDVYPRVLRDSDYSGFRDYFDQVYSITGERKIDDAIALELNRNTYHPVRDYFNGLEWDGKKRIDTLLIDCFDVEDNRYHRETIRKWMVAAVARAMNPGVKFDTVLALVGEEGTRKSTFLRKLGHGWHTDSFFTVEGTRAIEQIQGRLVIEIAEMSAFDRAESAQIKHFISKQEDIYRPAYGREDVTLPRQCVFAATANNRNFLRAGEGNRRFWPVDVPLPEETGGKLDPMSREFDEMIDQLWAEAVELWTFGESLILTSEASKMAVVEREAHVETDERKGVIEEFLETQVPENWDKMLPVARRMYLDDPEPYKKTNGALHRRNSISAIELWVECFGKRPEDFGQRFSREINAILRTIQGWSNGAKMSKLGVYGVQRRYVRKGTIV